MKKIYLVLLLTATLTPLFSQNIPSNLPAAGLVGWWPLDGDANDRMGSGNNGVIFGATPAFDRSGKTSGALRFNGTSNYISLPQPFFNGQSMTEFSMMVSFKPANVNGGYVWNKNGFWQGVGIVAGSDLYFGGSVPTYKYHSCTTAANTIQPDTWYTAVIVFQGQSCKIYLNGVLMQVTLRTSDSGGGFVSNTMAGFVDFAQTAGGNSSSINYIGAAQGPGSFFNGDIDDLAIWNRALTEAEALQVYSGKSAVTVTDADGNVYNTVAIGSQVWMKENLKTTRYADGSTIQLVSNVTNFAAQTTGAYIYWQNNQSYDAVYGKLYNWYAANDARNICPSGWHVPSDGEWTQLTDFLGGEPVAGTKLKSLDAIWEQPNSATNSSGFSALPGGYFHGELLIFGDLPGRLGQWWSSTEKDGLRAYSRFLVSSATNAYRQGEGNGKNYGFSIRCLKNGSNSAPSSLDLSSLIVQSGEAVGTAVGLISASDAEGGVISYSLVFGEGSADNAAFTIEGATLKTAAVFDTKIKSAFNIRVRATDRGGLYFEKALTVYVLPSYLPKEGLVGWWPFNGNAIDESGSGNDGSINGTDFQFGPERAGKINSALFINLNSTPSRTLNGAYVSATRNPLMDFTKDFTVNVWVNTSSKQMDETNEQFIDNGIYGYGFGSAIKGVVYSGNDNVSSGWTLGYNSSITYVGKVLAPIRDVWKFYSTVRSGNSLLLFVDGVFAASVPINSDPVLYPVLTFGKYQNTVNANTWQLIGGLDDITFYNRALTPSEIQSLSSSGNAAPSDLMLSATSITEGLIIGSSIGTLTAVDSDGGEFGFTLVSGDGSNDNSSFAIEGSTLKTTAVFNYNTKSSYSIRVRATDAGGLFTEKEFAISVFPNYLPTNGLIGWWPFNGNAKDISTNNYNGILSGTLPAPNRLGEANSALQFNGSSDYIGLNGIAAQGNAARSISLWVKSGKLSQCFLSTGEASIAGSFNLVQFSLGRPGVMGYAYDFYPTTGLQVNDNSWHMVTTTYDGLNLKLYVDGILQNQTQMGGYQTSGQANFVGKKHGADPQFFQGLMDDLMIWNRSLTSEEVTALYTGSTQATSLSFNISTGNQYSYGDSPVAYQIVVTPGLTTNVTSSNQSVVAVTGGKLDIKGAGTATVTATVPGTLLIAEQVITVNKAPLSVTAENKSRKFGEANPAFTLAYSGFKNNETSTVIDTAPTASTTATAASNVGTYPITVSGGTDNNYTFSYAAGTLTILKATQSIAFAPISDVAQSAGIFSLSATAAPGLPVTFTSSDPSRVSISGSTAAVNSPGPVTITASQAGNGNYEAAASVARSFCVLPTAPVVSITGGPVLTLNSSATSGNQWFKNGQAVSGANGTTLEVSESAIFTVKSTIEGCASPLSEAVNLIITGDTNQRSEAESPVELFPNPVSTELQYRLSESWSKGSSVRLMSASGKALITHHGQSEGIMDVRALPAGMYLFQVRKGRESVVRKVIKQ